MSGILCIGGQAGRQGEGTSCRAVHAAGSSLAYAFFIKGIAHAAYHAGGVFCPLSVFRVEIIVFTG